MWSGWSCGGGGDCDVREDQGAEQENQVDLVQHEWFQEPGLEKESSPGKGEAREARDHVEYGDGERGIAASD